MAHTLQEKKCATLVFHYNSTISWVTDCNFCNLYQWSAFGWTYCLQLPQKMVQVQ